MSADEAKERGRKAFQEEKWDMAIAHFTEVIDADPSEVTCLAIRSSAYQKLGDLERALQDAEQTITLMPPTYVRGYIRKACVLRALKEYGSEIDTYLAGLEHCPGDDSLINGLAMARRLKQTMATTSTLSPATAYPATRYHTAISRQVPAHQTADTLRRFVSQTRMNLELQMVALQAQLDLVSELWTKNAKDKMDLLFQIIIMVMVNNNSNNNNNNSGHGISISQLVTALEKASIGLKIGDAIREALLAAVPVDEASDDDNNNMLTRDTLETWVQNVLTNWKNATLDDFVSFMVFQVLFPRVDAFSDASASAAELEPSSQEQDILVVKEESKAVILDKDEIPNKSIWNDERMQALFVLFDKDADSTVDFKEVAIGLYPLTKKNMGEAAQKTAALLLMIDKNDSRVLTLEQFAKLMLAVSGAFGMTFDELADQLTLALGNSIDNNNAAVSNNNRQQDNEAIMKEIMVAEEAYTKAAEQRREEDKKKKTLDALSYSRTRMLFEMWDVNGDGTIDFQELLHGIRRYHKAAMGSKSLTDAERDALMIMGHDDDNNQTLDPEEFAYAMADYAENGGTDLHELIDFMCVVTTSQSSSAMEYETKFEEAMTQQRSVTSRFKPNMGTILDVTERADDEGEEEEEEEEAGW